MLVRFALRPRDGSGDLLTVPLVRGTSPGTFRVGVGFVWCRAWVRSARGAWVRSGTATGSVPRPRQESFFHLYLLINRRVWKGLGSFGASCLGSFGAWSLGSLGAPELGSFGERARVR